MKSVALFLAVLIWQAAVAAEVSLPPKLPDGQAVASFTDDGLLVGPESMKDVAVAGTAPVVDFMYYPGQTYEGNPWSNWSDGVAVGGKYYSAIGDHKAPQGNAYVYEYDSASRNLRCIVNLQKVLSGASGKYRPGKIHSRIDMGRDGWLYFATHRGSTRVTTDEYGYEGDWIIRHNPASGVSEIVVRGPVGKQCIPCSVLDPERLVFYGGTAAGDYSDKRITFFAYDVKAGRLLYSGYGGPARYMMFSRSKGCVYFVPALQGRVFRYDPAGGGGPVELDAEMGIRAATKETGQGYIYTVSQEGAVIYRFDTGDESVKRMGEAAVGSQSYTTSIDAGPGGRYLYYVPGAHGGSEKDGSAVVQFDVRTGGRKVIAYLHPTLKERFGYTPLGTFSTAVSDDGAELYITWNGNLGRRKGERLTWDACALTVIHIPKSERLP